MTRAARRTIFWALGLALTSAHCGGDDQPAVISSTSDGGAGEDASAEPHEAAGPAESGVVDVRSDVPSQVTPTCTPACGAGSMCCPTALSAECVPASAGGCKMADLTVDEDELKYSVIIDWRYFPPTDCALIEQCVGGSGWRRLLRFATVTPNIGTADLVVGRPEPTNATFEYSACHDHYHFVGYANYQLQGEGGSVAARGHKQAFCLEDLAQLGDGDVDAGEKFTDAGKGSFEICPATDGGSGDAGSKWEPVGHYTCDDQGISAGYEDIYSQDLDCQWVDITNVPAGDYKLRVAINESGKLKELRYDNNQAVIDVNIPSAPNPVDPTEPCLTDEAWSGPQDCGWTAESTPHTCTPNESLKITCSGGSCDACNALYWTKFRICPGDKPCAASDSVRGRPNNLYPPADGGDVKDPALCTVGFHCPKEGKFLLLQSDSTEYWSDPWTPVCPNPVVSPAN